MDISFSAASEKSGASHQRCAVKPSKDSGHGHLEIAPSSQLTLEESGIGHSAGRHGRPAQ